MSGVAIETPAEFLRAIPCFSFYTEHLNSPTWNMHQQTGVFEIDGAWWLREICGKEMNRLRLQEYKLNRRNWRRKP